MKLVGMLVTHVFQFALSIKHRQYIRVLWIFQLLLPIKPQVDLHTMESKHSARENLCKSLHKNVLSFNSYECQRAGLKIERSENCERSEQYFPVLSNVRRC